MSNQHPTAARAVVTLCPAGDGRGHHGTRRWDAIPPGACGICGRPLDGPAPIIPMPARSVAA